MIQQIVRDRLRTGAARGAMSELLTGERARIFYTDPPWGPGMMTYFQNLAEKETGQEVERVTYDELLRDLCQQASAQTDGPVIIEYGTQWFTDVQSIGTAAGLIPEITILTPYAGGQYHVHVFSSPTVSVRGEARAPEYTLAVTAAKTGLQVVKAVIAPWVVEDGILVDLCSGFGLMAKAAKAAKMRFYGNELNPKRLKRNHLW